ncbi:hypothetical protein EJ04DRAFT_597873 [Polyplosphaeria fusca]|uniref:Uncharacterized protein n=1 Tax=Polyplosphaeria fusca TaxID=682080 RepID=A0A9P4R875_9PLEO|nr:hypothetical protein EJ04DRAFT_597873 [Polyplosphaeria fusca]
MTKPAPPVPPASNLTTSKNLQADNNNYKSSGDYDLDRDPAHDIFFNGTSPTGPSLSHDRHLPSPITPPLSEPKGLSMLLSEHLNTQMAASNRLNIVIDAVKQGGHLTRTSARLCINPYEVNVDATVRSFYSAPALAGPGVTVRDMHLGTSQSAPSMKPSTSSRRRHLRTLTPEQRAIRGIMGGPVYTIGIERQDDRPMLADYFDEILTWAANWTTQGEHLSQDEIYEMAEQSGVMDFLTDHNDRVAVLADNKQRVHAVAAIVGYNIAYYAMCDHFLYNSEHGDAYIADKLYDDYNKLEKLYWRLARSGWDTLAQKDRVLEQMARVLEQKAKVLEAQKAFYKDLCESGNIRDWRETVAENKCASLFKKLGSLIKPAAKDDLRLLELYSKGYRIGFRLRMDDRKVKMTWPSPGSTFDARSMVNESRDKDGAFQTAYKSLKYPSSFSIRFARSPLITATEIVWNYERRTVRDQLIVLHSSLVQTREKPRYIGAEREDNIHARDGHN